MSLRTDLGLYRRVLRPARPYWGQIAGIFALDLMASPLALLAPIPLKIAVDNVLGGRPLSPPLQWIVPGEAVSRAGALALAAGLMILITALAQAQSVAASLLRSYTSEKLVLEFRALVFRHVQHLSLSWHDRSGSADSVYRIQYDAPAIQYIAIDGTIPFATSAATLVAMLYVTARLDWQLTLIGVAIAPLLLWLSRRYRPLLRTQSREVKRHEYSALAVVQEVLGALRVVKAFGREEGEHDRYVRVANDGMRSRLRLALSQGRYGSGVGLITALGAAAALWLGVKHVGAGTITLGELLLVMTYLSQLFAPLKTIGQKAAGLQGYLASAERVFAVLDQAADAPEMPNARQLIRARGDIRYSHVGFGYDPKQPVLHDVSFFVPHGARVGIGGRTGAGKTTLLNLLLRFYQPDEGRILLDGVDVREYRIADLRNQFALVLQEPVLFSTSIAENIAYARPEAGMDAVVTAAKLASAHDFIMKLPEGYQTRVGERGMRLSGGERQRISLARAFLKDAPILLLDEPTSSVDLKTEATIIQAMERLMRGRTTFIITHRLSTIEDCDVRLEMDDGRVSTVAPAGEAGCPANGEPRNVSPAVIRDAKSDPERVVKAWLRVAPRSPQPTNVIVLKSRGHSFVCRLDGVGDRGSGVIAKYCSSDGAEIESAVYRDVLSRMPVPALRCYGWLRDDDEPLAGWWGAFGPVTRANCLAAPPQDGTEAYGWLFVEDAGDEWYSASDQHRDLAGRWLRNIHAASAQCSPPGCLPERRPAWYREELRTLRQSLLQCLGNPALAAADIRTLETIHAQCGMVDSHWQDLDNRCEGAPVSLVHGDLSAKNLRVRNGGAGDDLVAIDWETAGWGVPAIDLASLNAGIGAYASATPPRLAEDEIVERLAIPGQIFRLIISMGWETAHLAGQYPTRAMSHMRLYQQRLAESMQAAAWEVQ